MALSTTLNKKTSDPLHADLKIAVNIGERLIRSGGADVIMKAMKSSSDPGQVIGQFLLQMGQQMMEKMPSQMKLSPKILLAKDGWLEQMSDFIQAKLGVPKQIMDKAEIYVASTASAMANAKRQQGGGMINGVSAPPAPQAGPGMQPNAAAPQGQPAMPQPNQGGGY